MRSVVEPTRSDGAEKVSRPDNVSLRQTESLVVRTRTATPVGAQSFI